MGRLKLWVMLFTSSIVTLTSLMSVLENRKDVDWAKHEKWIVSVASISIAMSFFGILASMLPEETALKLESPLISIVLGFWSAGMSSLLDPDHDLAIGAGYAINNANLFFFGWGSLVSSIVLAGEWSKEANGDAASPVALKWFLLCASSLTVMGSSASLYNSTSCKNIDDSSYCNRTNFAIYLGLCSGVMAFLMAGFKQAPMICHSVVSILLFVCWCCGVSYITFGTGPGINLGNVYFATWISMFLCLNLCATSIQLAVGEKMGGNSEEEATTDKADAEPESAGDVDPEVPGSGEA